MTDATKKKFVFFLFFASGISGLIYEVIWLRMLSRVFGVTTYAAAITMAAFMAGLGIGSFIFGKIADKSRNPLKIYSLLQLLISITALLTPLLFEASVPVYKSIYVISGQSRTIVMLLRAIMSFATLLIPTIIMGGTLPLLAGYLTRKDKMFGTNLSVLYGLNTIGAVIGVLSSGFITIGVFGEWATIFSGVIINLLVAGAVLLIDEKKAAPAEQQRNGMTAENADGDMISSYPDHIRRMVLAAIFISGFTALAYEVIWTRQLILYLYVSIYAFSAMLSVFLMGVGTGSLVINFYINKLKTPLFLFGILELAVGTLSLTNLYIFPLFGVTKFTRGLSPFFLVFPITFLFGMIFPLATVCFAKTVNKAGSSIGSVYVFNTAGNMLGSLVTGFILVSLIGSTKTIILLALINVLIGLVILFFEPGKPTRLKIKYTMIVPVVALLALGMLKKDVFLDVTADVIKKRARPPADSTFRVFFNKECIQGTVTSYQANKDDSTKGICINGSGQTSLCTETKIMAHLPVLLADNPKKFLAICFGMGTIIKSASIYADMDITAVDLVPELFECFKYYHKEADEILKNKNIKLVAEDGRNYLLLSPDKFDVISVDPSPPLWSAGTVNLYTKEFYQLCKEHLTPGGVMCMWFLGGAEAETGMIINTFASVFQYMQLWKGPHNYGFYMIGKLEDFKVDRAKLETIFKNKKIVEDLSEYDRSCVTSSQMYGLLYPDYKSFVKSMEKYPVITDNYPYTEFPLFEKK